MLSPRRRTLLIAFAVFAALSALAVYASPLSARSLQARLQEAAEQALYDARAEEWASVDLDGQVATVTGRAPDREARDRAIEAVRRAEWTGGVVAGGVTRVIDETRLAQSAEPFGLRADLVAGRLTLTGFAPDGDAAERIESTARRLFSERVEIDMRLAPGGAPAGWESAVRLLLSELARLETGSAVMRDDRMVLTGLAANAQTASSVRSAFAALPEAFTGSALVRAPGGAYETRLDDRVLCELAISAAMGSRAIAFSPGGAQLSDGSSAALRRAGEAFARCDGTGVLRIRVRPAGEDDGRALAQARAAALADAVEAGGAGRGRIETGVLEDDSGRPLAFDVIRDEEAAPGDETAPGDEPLSEGG